MTQNNEAEEIAAEIRRGYEACGGPGAVEALCQRLADTVEVWHKPRIPFEHKMSKDFIHKARKKEVSIFSNAMPDYQETGNLVVNGDEIIFDMQISGTYKGNPVNFVMPCILKVEGDKITGFGHTMKRSTLYWMLRFQLGRLWPFSKSS